MLVEVLLELSSESNHRNSVTYKAKISSIMKWILSLLYHQLTRFFGTRQQMVPLTFSRSKGCGTADQSRVDLSTKRRMRNLADEVINTSNRSPNQAFCLVYTHVIATYLLVKLASYLNKSSTNVSSVALTSLWSIRPGLSATPFAHSESISLD